VLVHYDGDDRFNGTVSVVAIGVFDGVHRGHQEILANLKAEAERYDAKVGVITFWPHPASVIHPERPVALIQSLEQRLEALASFGVEQVRVVGFSENTAATAAPEFVQDLVVNDMHAKCVVVGEDFRFGHDRLGDVELLVAIGKQEGFRVLATKIQGGLQRWSSTAIRHALRQGDVEGASEILGRPFTLRGIVAHGDARGRELGYPTANLEVAADQLVPDIGIYATAVCLADGSWWPGAVSVGTRPQFYDDGELLVEVHVPGFQGDLYDSTLNVAFLKRLRGEMTFVDVEALIAQIDRDVEETLETFGKFRPASPKLLG